MLRCVPLGATAFDLSVIQPKPRVGVGVAPHGHEGGMNDEPDPQLPKPLRAAGNVAGWLFTILSVGLVAAIVLVGVGYVLQAATS